MEAGEPRVRVTRTGRKHKIGVARILAAMIDAGEPIELGDQLHWVGLDDRGLELHIIGVPDDRRDGAIAIIHAQPTAQAAPKTV